MNDIGASVSRRARSSLRSPPGAFSDCDSIFCVGESGFGLIARFPYTAPYEDITLKSA